MRQHKKIAKKKSEVVTFQRFDKHRKPFVVYPNALLLA